MPGSCIDTNKKVSRADLIKQCKSVLYAGGTVYLGETHTKDDARKICCDVLKARCVQYLCLEFDSSCQGFMAGWLLDSAEQNLGHQPSKKISEVMKACEKSSGNVVLVDKQDEAMAARQQHIAEQISGYRRKLTLPSRGVLVLIGSDHLKDLNVKDGQWTALQKLVYNGLSFVHGKFESCKMVWQLS